MRRIRNLLLIIAILLIGIACMGKLYMLYTTWIGSHLQWVRSSEQNDRIVSIIGVLITLWLFLEKRLQTWRAFFGFSRFLWPLLILLFYGYTCLKHRDVFTPFNCKNGLVYADVAIGIFALWWLMPLLKDGWYKLKNLHVGEEEADGAKTTTEQKPPFEADEAEPKDELGRQDEADRLCDYIMSQGNCYDTTLAVAIRGEWGAGKSTFLTYLKKSFNAKGISYFDYSPWLCSDGEVAQHFLRHLDAHLHQQGIGVNSLQMYIQSLSVSNITGWFPLTVHAIRQLFTSGGDTLQGSLDAVCNSMGLLESPIVAFIDDVDRIGKEEFLNVMKLVRMTARFPNLIYVVAYDGSVAEHLLRDYGQGDKFLDKIFNLKHDLQPISEDKMRELAEKELASFAEYDRNLDVFGGLTLTDYVVTIRDLKHFFNLMRKDYIGMSHMRNRSYVHFSFFVKFELLKHYDFYVWQRIKDEPTAYLNTKNEWDDMMAYVVKAEMKQIGNKHTKELLAMLFDSEIAADCEYVCPGGLQMMYPDKYDGTYLSKQEVEEAVKKGHLYSEVYGWIKGGRKGIAFMLAHHLSDVSVTEMARVCEVMIKYRPNDIIKSTINKLLSDDTVNAFTFSQIRKQNNPYNYVGDHHELFLLVLQQVRNSLDDSRVKELMEYARKTATPRELMAIVYGMMMESAAHDMIADRWVYDVVLILFKKLADKESEDDITNQYHVVEAIEYLPYYKSQYQLLKPLLEKDLGIWLRWTIKYDETLGTDTILTADVDVLRTMFDTYEDYKALTMTLKDYYKSDEKQAAIIDEHRKLVEQTSLISALPISSFYQSEYPNLKDIIYQEHAMPPILHQNYEQTKDYLSKQEHPFFKNESRLPQLFD